MTQDLKPLIRDLLVEEIGINPGEIGDDTPLLSSGMVDSFALITILTAIESATGLTIEQDDLTLDNFDTLNHIQAFVSEQK
jgi:acyl carrier protein/D-alanine--poly(phosphoribitol) ligase subunit 2